MLSSLPQFLAEVELVARTQAHAITVIIHGVHLMAIYCPHPEFNYSYHHHNQHNCHIGIYFLSLQELE